MRRLLLTVLALALICELLCCQRATAFAGTSPGVSRSGDAPLDECQKKFAELLRFMRRENEYAGDKANYAEAVEDRCAHQKWYDFSILQYVLFVPLFGLILPFFGLMIFGAARSIRRTSSARALK